MTDFQTLAFSAEEGTEPNPETQGRKQTCAERCVPIYEKLRINTFFVYSRAFIVGCGFRRTSLPVLVLVLIVI